MAAILTLPGLIDCHVHFRDPGALQKENFESGMRSALAGGVTTVCDMPNTDPPTCTLETLQNKIARAQRILNSQFDIRFFFGITKQEHLRELEKVMKSEDLRKHVPGVKLYLGHSTGKQKVEEGIAELVFQVCSRLKIPVVCHCEDEEVIRANEGLGLGLGIEAHSKIRSVDAAVKATTFAISLSRNHGTQLHIAHISTGDEIALIRKAKKEGLPVTCEVAPHHLFLTVDDYETLGTLAKMNPPLRTRDHLAALWEGIRDGTVDCIASDHAPHTREEKMTPNPLDAPSGVPGVETMLPLLLSCVMGDGPIDAQGNSRLSSFRLKLTAPDIIRLLYEAPHHIFHLGRPDKPPEEIVVNPLANWVIRGKELHSKCGWTPYEGWTVQGKVESVIG